MLRKLLLALLSQLYLLGVKFRHSLFDCGFMRSERFDIPIICVGNITVGGTGKTPMCELLLEHFMQKGQVALLSRGYGRKSRGYREVLTSDDHYLSGDEPLQMKLKYPDALVVVCEKRVIGVRRIIEDHPDVKIIIMDDGFQHRHIAPALNIIMVDYTRPIYEDHPLPWGTLRDSIDELHRADYFVVTKCPEQLSEFDRQIFASELRADLHQKVLFTRIDNISPVLVFADAAQSDELRFTPSQEVIALSGIGNPKPFIEMVDRCYTLVDKMIYADHYSYTDRDIELIAERLEANPHALLLMTEKDSVKLLKMNNIPHILRNRAYYSPIRMKFLAGSQSELLLNIERDVRED